MSDYEVTKLQKRAKSLIKINKIATFVAIVWSLYLIFFPFFPNVILALENNKTGGEIPEFVLNAIEKYDGNQLIIPSIGVSQKIVEGTSIKGVGDDVWRRPFTSTPDKGSNTVLVAHRYRSIGGQRSSTFYHLPKLENGDRAFVYWDKVLYVYETYDTEVVLPTQVEIESPTIENELTLYTCTPLYTSTHRHVLHLKLTKKINI